MLGDGDEVVLIIVERTVESMLIEDWLSYTYHFCKPSLLDVEASQNHELTIVDVFFSLF